MGFDGKRGGTARRVAAGWCRYNFLTIDRTDDSLKRRKKAGAYYFKPICNSFERNALDVFLNYDRFGLKLFTMTVPSFILVTAEYFTKLTLAVKYEANRISLQN